VAYNLDHLNRLNNAAVKLQAKSRIYWPFIEMTMEFHSSGQSFDDRLRQAQSYAAYLLAARPDLDSTFDLLVEKNCMIIYLCFLRNQDGQGQKIRLPHSPRRNCEVS